MPRRTAAGPVVPVPAPVSVPATPPLAGCAIALSGKFDFVSHSHASLEKLIKELGGTVTRSVTKATTHLVCTENDFNDPTPKVLAAKAANLPLVTYQWIDESETAGKTLPIQSYLWDKSNASATKKRPVSPKDKEDGVGDDGPEAKKSKTEVAGGGADASEKPAPRARRNPAASAAAVKEEDPEAKMAEKDKQDQDKKISVAQFLKNKNVSIPVDAHFPLLGLSCAVYIEPDTGLIYDASLNQTHASFNANKFYLLQIVGSPDGYFRTWTRWGRVGEKGQSAILGDGSLAEAIKHFEKKFREKSGLAWTKRTDPPKPGKYAFVERSYNPDDEDDGHDEEAQKDAKQAEPEREPPPCTLEPAVQSLMELIFNKQLFQDTMNALNYDANKLPLGKLSKGNILRGFEQLKDLAALMDDPTLAESRWRTSISDATEQLSNLYYSIIPHVFGRNRPPVIRDKQTLKREIDLLESLSDMKVANEIMKDPPALSDENVLDTRFKGLGLEEMTVLDHNGSEFSFLKDYLTLTCGYSHDLKYQIQDIFRIERRGEQDQFDKYAKNSRIGANRRLLWHGSRVTNYGGILSQGLRIAPPEAPATGYMFGKGIYLADMSSKSAGYCRATSSKGEALLLLCEAKLGDPMLSLYTADYGAQEAAFQKGCESTHGVGRFGPNVWTDAAKVHPSLSGVMMPDLGKCDFKTAIGPLNAAVLYNEYICYDVAQVRLRYLFRVKIKTTS